MLTPGCAAGLALAPAGPAAGFLFNGANLGGQPDWGNSVYLDGSLPTPGPERCAMCPAGSNLLCKGRRQLVVGRA